MEGAKSQYDIVAGGRLVFSKQEQGRFPESEEIFTALRD
jgi:predicted Rdx family selenoprotein